MDTKTISLLREWAKTYNTESFIKDDPVRFPHRFTEKRDIEISAFITSWRDFFRSPTEPPGSQAGYLLPFLYLS